jgi:hypothetical protein
MTSANCGLKILFLSTVLFTLPTHAGQLASIQVTDNIVAYVPSMSQVWLRVSLSDPTWGCWSDSPPACYQISYSAASVSSIGSTLVINASTNPEFASIAGMLADGADNWICFSADPTPKSSSGGGTCAQESMFAGFSGLAGSNITSIDLTINTLTFGTMMWPALPPANGFVQVSSENSGLTLAINGTAVPEANSVGLAACGLLLAALDGTRRSGAYRRGVAGSRPITG